MSKRIKTNDTDIRVNTLTVDVVTINGFSFKHNNEEQYICIYVGGDEDEGESLYESVDISEFINLEGLKIFALNWYFDNVEIVKSIL